MSRSSCLAAFVAAAVIIQHCGPVDASAQGFGLTAEAFAEGSARFLTERAEAEVSMFVLEQVISRLCRTVGERGAVSTFRRGAVDTHGLVESYQVTARHLLPATCALLDPPGGDRLATQVAGLGTLRSALRQDLRNLVRNAVGLAALRIDAMPDGAQKDRTRIALATLDLMQAMVAVALRERNAGRGALDWGTVSAELLTRVPDAQRGLCPASASDNISLPAGVRNAQTRLLCNFMPFWDGVSQFFSLELRSAANALIGGHEIPQAALREATLALQSSLVDVSRAHGNARAAAAASLQALAHLEVVLEPVMNRPGLGRLGASLGALREGLDRATPVVNGDAAAGLRASLAALRDVADAALRSPVGPSLTAMIEATRLEDPEERSRELVQAMLAVGAQAARHACEVDAAARCPSEAVDLIDPAVELTSALIRKDYADAMALMWSALGDTLALAMAAVTTSGRAANAEERREWIHTATRFLALMADLATAEDADGVEATLDRFADPVGSWRGKHGGRWGLTLQGYAGLRFGHERLVNSPHEPGRALAPALAFGLQLHYGGRAARFVLFAQVLDIGNVVSVRLTEDDDTAVNVDTVPDITWAQLFSPGLYVGFSPGPVPVDLLFGFNYVPELRTADNERRSAFQVGMMLVVDVSIMRLR